MGKISVAVCLACVWCLAVQEPAGAFEKKMSRALSHYIMGVMYDDLGELDTAILEYRQALRSDTHAVGVRLDLAAALIKKNELSQAIAELKTVARYSPEAVEPHAILALIYSSQDKLDEATAEYELALVKASKLQPKNVAIYKNLGLVYLQQERLQEARAVYELVVQLAPDDAAGHFVLASVYQELREPERVETHLKRALALRPDFHQALNFLGYFYVEEGRNFEEAQSLILKALEMEPINGAYIDSLGWLYFQQGEFGKSLEYLQKASLFLDDPVIYDHLGDAYLKLGETVKAVESWRKSLELDPKQQEVNRKIQHHQTR